jgi:hypothetical protein
MMVKLFKLNISVIEKVFTRKGTDGTEGSMCVIRIQSNNSGLYFGDYLRNIRHKCEQLKKQSPKYEILVGNSLNYSFQTLEIQKCVSGVIFNPIVQTKLSTMRN